jgi:hypothetical protein
MYIYFKQHLFFKHRRKVNKPHEVFKEPSFCFNTVHLSLVKGSIWASATTLHRGEETKDLRFWDGEDKDTGPCLT